MKSAKAKGSRAERELVAFFNEHGWSCLRAAGSGSSKYPAPDILAGNAIRRVAIECKVTKDEKKYIPNAEIEQLNTFAKNFGAEAWIGVKLGSNEWFFLMPEDAEKTAGSHVISLKIARLRGLRKEELLGNSSNDRNI